jgi:hypothetical protein
MVTFADCLCDAYTKEEGASFFKGVQCNIGLEVPVLPFKETRNMNIFLDHQVVGYGLLRSVPFPFEVSQIDVRATTGEN